MSNSYRQNQIPTAPPPPQSMYNFEEMNQLNQMNQMNQFVETQDQKLDRIKRQYEISPYFARKLEMLRGMEIVMLCDDSGSMTQVGSYDKQLSRALTRWEELRQRTTIIMEIATIMDPDGIDIYFLNRSPAFGIRDVSQVDQLFTIPPAGGTQLTKVFNQILQDKSEIIKERKVLIIIATDGEPRQYDSCGRDIDGKHEFMKALQNRKPIDRLLVSIMACTDDDKVMSYLNKIDKNVKFVDVLDDYENEKKEILEARGRNFIFNLGDYIVKTLVGPMDPELDNLDEKNKCIIL